MKFEMSSNFYCVSCNISFKTSSHFFNHNYYKHGESTKCHVCGVIFSSRKKCNQHIYRRHSDKKYFCSHCGKGFMKNSTFQIHLRGCGERRKINKFDLMCDRCKKSFCNKSSVRHHTRTVHTNKNMASDKSCDICNMVFKKKCELKIHMRIHIQYETQCKECQLTFATRIMLMTHINKCHPDVLYQCKTCEKRFLMRRAYRQHCARVHPHDLFQCPLCKRKFKLRRCMEEHREKKRCKIDLKPWDQLTRMSAKRYRLNLVIQQITQPDGHMNKNKNICLYKSLMAMTEKEREVFQDMIDDKLNTSKKDTGEKEMRVEDVINLVKYQWLGIECPLCGEEVRSIVELQQHHAQYHPSQNQEAFSYKDVAENVITDV